METVALSAETFSRFAQVISTELGIKMPASKLPLVQSRLMRRVRELQLGSLDEYCDYLLSSPSRDDERVHFANAITTNKTDFFREPAHFDFLVQKALPSLGYTQGSKALDRLAVWSAGCSSGEEAYTLAMVLNEYSEDGRWFNYAILGTDISTRVLDHARAGIYPEAQLEPVPARLQRKYLLRSRDGRQLVRISPHLRRKVGFHRLNFMDADYGVADLFDVIFFRNVMIYFDRPTQEAVINKLCRNLRSGGYLFVGLSESLTGLDVPVSPVGPSVLRKEA